MFTLARSFSTSSHCERLLLNGDDIVCGCAVVDRQRCLMFAGWAKRFAHPLSHTHKPSALARGVSTPKSVQCLAHACMFEYFTRNMEKAAANDTSWQMFHPKTLHWVLFKLIYCLPKVIGVYVILWLCVCSWVCECVCVPPYHHRHSRSVCSDAEYRGVNGELCAFVAIHRP